MKPKTESEIAIMREGGKRLAAILQELAKQVAPGVAGKQISQKAAELIKNNQMQAVVLGYEGFPDVMCISVNGNIVHGVPSKQPFKDGDVVKLDLTLGYKSLIVDSAITVIVGQAERLPAGRQADVKRLVDGTKKALDSGIAAIKGDGTRVGDISSAVQDVLDQHKLGIIRDLVGHGIGYNIHEDPNIPNYGVAGTGPKLSQGMTICVEPMAALGDWHVDIEGNGNVVMRDSSLSAHFEHTVLITDNGCEILTTT